MWVVQVFVLLVKIEFFHRTPFQAVKTHMKEISIFAVGVKYYGYYIRSFSQLSQLQLKHFHNYFPLIYFWFIIPIRHSLYPMKGERMAGQPQGCARVTGTVEEKKPETAPVPTPVEKEMRMTARVGQKAPDFTAPAYYRGGFTSVKLSDYLGKWVLLCFYPGDFTFV